MSLSKKNKITLIILIVVILAGYSTYKYTYQPHKSIDEIAVKFSGSSQDFLEKVKTEATPWQDVIVQLTGTITAIDKKGITLINSIYCQLEKGNTTTNLKAGQTITVKGRMIGFDDLLEEIKLDQTSIK